MSAHKGPRTFTMPDGSTIYLCDACKGGIGVTLCPLHAAAPALLEALEVVVMICESGQPTNWRDIAIGARAAIANVRDEFSEETK